MKIIPKHILLIFTLLTYNTLAMRPSDSAHSATSSMMPLPLTMDFNGMLSWGYHLDFSGPHHGGMDHGDMDHGDMDHGGMDHGDMDHDDTMDSGHSDGSWMYGVMPMISLGYDKFTRITNLESQSNNGITYESNSNSYVVSQNQTMSAGFGAMLMAMPPVSIPLFSWKLSMMPYKGSSVYKRIYVSSKSEATKINDISIPTTLGEIGEWSVNDQIIYSTKGGVMFGAGAGMSILASVMRTYMAEGIWQKTITKVDDTMVSLSVRQQKVTMLATKLNNVLVSLSSAKMNNVDQGFNYLYDLSSSDALLAYQKALKGDLLATQHLVNTGSLSVEHVSDSKSVMLGKSKKFKVGLPIVFNSVNTSGTMEHETTSTNSMSGQKSKVTMSSYRKTHTTNGLLSKHKNGGIVSMSMIKEDLKSEAFNPRFAMSYLWYYSKDKLTSKRLQKSLQKASQLLGIDKLNTMSTPKTKKLGYVKAEINFGLAHENIINLIKSDNKILAYDIDKMVTTTINTKREARKFCLNKDSVQKCQNTIVTKTNKATKKISILIDELKRAYKSKDINSLSTVMGKLNELSLTNRFVLHSFLKSAGVSSLNAILSVEGENVVRDRISILKEI